MFIVGITHPISRNSAACILKNGKLIAMAEEERFNRIKHSPRTFPNSSLDFCLHKANVTIEDVDYIAVAHARPASALWNIRFGKLKEGIYWAKKQYVDLKNSQKKLEILYKSIKKNKVIFIRHHLCHAASAFYSSAFDESIIISLDGSGDREAGLLGYGEENEIKIINIIPNYQSVGKIYEYVTEALGFKFNSEEGKTMGLAPYGNPDIHYFPFVKWDGKYPEVDIKLVKDYFDNIRPRDQDFPLSEIHKDMAASIQLIFENIVIEMANYLHQKTNLNKICLAGGAALNCSMNGKLALLPWVKEIFVQPASHDAGSALGAALFLQKKITNKRPQWEMEHVYWGPEYSNEQILQAINLYPEVSALFSGQICSDVAQRIAEGQVVGWFQGRLEIGPRALGNRSIIGDPSRPEMKDLINKKVKNREPWRPFAPSILEEKMSRYFDNFIESPYMILAFDTNPKYRHEIISAIHIDGTARPQSVSQKTNSRFWELIHQFEIISGIPALLNTSFNVAKQPIVNTPKQALQTFLDCGMDCLAIGDYIITKNR